MKQISPELVQNILNVMAAAVHPSTPFNAILNIGQQLEALKDVPEVKESCNGGTDTQC